MSNKSNRFANLGFEDFRKLAKDESLSKYERIGFPDAYRSGKEELIFKDIVGKLTLLNEEGKTILDIGPGCSDLPRIMVNHCKPRKHSLILVDSPEMLDQLPEDPCVEKIAAFYPDCTQLIDRTAGKVDVILCYSVLHYIFVDTSIFRFLDISLSLLAPGGQMLIGDIPNVSKRKRFFASETGIRFHQEFMKTTDMPEVEFNRIEHAQIDDAVILSLLQRARAQGFDAYVLPQNIDLPMANRREDILIVRP
ncbi:MAG: class I SAM-dependent methyltransferase [Nitrosomonas sp.]|nr:class I SAM-dependent methyltransferase [Nitrosomonas sp.]MBY0579316.1 class I SAM-dependent methyltransferase [Burkholderiales bacterium]